MPIYEITSDRLEVIPETTFQAVGLRERQDLQRLLRQHIAILSPDTLVIDEDHGRGRGIDLLGVDRRGDLVVVDLLRAEDAQQLELNALRGAASVASLTFEQAASSYQAFLTRQGTVGESAHARLLEFLGWKKPDEDRFGLRMRVVLAAPDFSEELAQTVLWLGGQGIEVRCVRVKPYSYGKRLMLEVTQVIPPPEAAAHEAARSHKESLARLNARMRAPMRRTPASPTSKSQPSSE